MLRHLVLTALFTLACDRRQDSTPSPEPAGPAPSKLEIVLVPGSVEPVAALVQRESERARTDGRDLVVYVGATWCEPCTRFHDAAAAGKLDTVFPRLRLLEFDQDRDGERLVAAGCGSQFIPLFARPSADGRCSAVRIEGSIKGEGAVAEITPKLQRLLAQAP